MLLPLKRVVWPTDFSNPSFDALKGATELAAHFNAQLLLLHVLPEIPRPGWAESLLNDSGAYEPGLSGYKQTLHEAALRKLDQVIATRLPKDLESRALVVEGDAAIEIVRIAEDERAGLIVIATHGMTGWRQVAFGSVAERVVRLSWRPVLTVRAPRDRF